MSEPSYPSYRSSAEMLPAQRFFFMYFMADSLDDQLDVEEAVDAYLLGQAGPDPDGRRLLDELDDLIAGPLTDDQIADRIEVEWDADGGPGDVGATARELLRRIRAHLMRRAAESA
ncbi:contact-dependent growth inhibition system immunity protein [Micromonospora sp. WMMD712]|uniref:contact-dependent growth inhibition system immunity protein n=1 Tax=Micromonospora sp. WMMD712 TaxID=3016096 RepID=UPI00249BB7A1|nr:contact-dependent growth inhibition system immunity protein [Micromonospora sp. WMMD712]WFE59217.1 contact-dependent growth inhibition system immunity protein [Micromonospora sp. WMMD712]